MGKLFRTKITENQDLLQCEKMTIEDFEELVAREGSSMFVVGITSQTIASGDFTYINSFFDVIMDSPSAKKCKFYLTVNGYDNDSRELYAIKEVREYLSKAFNYRPGVMARMTLETVRLFLVNESVAKVKGSDGITTNVMLDKDKILNFVKKVTLDLDDAEDLLMFNKKYKEIMN